MMKSASFGLGLLLLVASAAFACGGGEETASGGGSSSGGEDPYAGPLTSADITGGQVLFDDLCGSCHPGGDAGEGPSIRNLGWEAGRVRRQVREGTRHMPPVPEGRLDAAGLENVLAYLTTLGTVSDALPGSATDQVPVGAVEPPPPAEGDTAVAE